MLQSNTCLLDTDAGLNNTNSKLIHNNWMHKVKSHPTPRLRSEIKDPIKLFGIVLVFVQIETQYVKFWFI